MPRSAITCSGALRAMMRPNCPGPKPSERSARVTAATWSRYSANVSVFHSPLSFQCSAGWSPHLATAAANSVQTVFPETALSMAARSASTSITGNTLLVGGGEVLIYVRSHRSIVSIGVAGIAWAAAFGVLALAAAKVPEGWIASVALGAGAVAGGGVAVWAAFRLLSWPRARLCFFRDRLLVIQGRHEMRAVWSAMEAVTLSEPHSWPHVKVTDRLTIQLKNEPPLILKPATFGLEPAACRDLIVRLRDEPKLRVRLPEFDSWRDLVVSPVVAGELIDPRL